MHKPLIRPTTLEDVPVLVSLAKVMHTESKFRVYDFDKHMVALAIEESIEDGIALTAVVDDTIVGGFIGCIQSHFFGRDTCSYDLATFVAPEHRTGSVGMRLIQGYVAAAKAKGVDECVISNSTGIDKERVAHLFERAGFSHDGFVFSMDLKTA